LEEAMSFQATDFEFRQRFWFIGGIIWLAFTCYSFDHMNAAVALARVILGRGASLDSPETDRYGLMILGAGTAVVALGALIRSWAEAYLHSSVVHDMELHSERLVAEGPYRHVRNPLYLGNILLAAGFGLMASRIGFVVMAVGMFAFCYRLILREEAGLLASQGESYRRYFEAVPRLLPSLLPRIPASNARPNWRDGFAGESFMWGIVAGMAVFVATERIVYFWIVMGAGFAVYFVQGFLRGKGEKK
jgi:protein-S-isoprenylcysteine O-methyltransferase Ste14